MRRHAGSGTRVFSEILYNLLTINCYKCAHEGDQIEGTIAMWRFLGGLALGAGLGALASGAISPPHAAFPDGGGFAPAPHILHQLTRLDRLEDDQPGAPGIKKPGTHMPATAATNPTHSKQKSLVAAGHTAPAHQSKSRVAKQQGAKDARDINEAMLPGVQGTQTDNQDATVSSQPYQDVTMRGNR